MVSCEWVLPANPVPPLTRARNGKRDKHILLLLTVVTPFRVSTGVENRVREDEPPRRIPYVKVTVFVLHQLLMRPLVCSFCSQKIHLKLVS